MTTKKLTALIAFVPTIINLHMADHSGCDYDVSPFFEQTDPGSESLTITFSNSCEFDYEFLEPLAKLLGPTKIKWSVQHNDDKFGIILYY